MTDLSYLLAWLFVLAGAAASVLLGRAMRGPKNLGGVAVAAILSSILGLVLGVGIAFTQTACIEQFHACISQGDGELSLWMYSMWAIPAYCLLMLAFPRAGGSARQVR